MNVRVVAISVYLIALAGAGVAQTPGPFSISAALSVRLFVRDEERCTGGKLPIDWPFYCDIVLLPGW